MPAFDIDQYRRFDIGPKVLPLGPTTSVLTTSALGDHCCSTIYCAADLPAQHRLGRHLYNAILPADYWRTVRQCETEGSDTPWQLRVGRRRRQSPLTSASSASKREEDEGSWTYATHGLEVFGNEDLETRESLPVS